MWMMSSFFEQTSRYRVIKGTSGKPLVRCRKTCPIANTSHVLYVCLRLSRSPIGDSKAAAIVCISGAQKGFSKTGNNAADFSGSSRVSFVNAIRKSVITGVALRGSYRIISGWILK